MDGSVICDVVSIVAQWRGKERHEPYRADPQFLEVIELLFQPLKITDPIPAAILKSTNVYLIDDGVFDPKNHLIEAQGRSLLRYCHFCFVGHGKSQVYTK